MYKLQERALRARFRRQIRTRAVQDSSDSGLSQRQGAAPLVLGGCLARPKGEVTFGIAGGRGSRRAFCGWEFSAPPARQEPRPPDPYSQLLLVKGAVEVC
jgi:hypothetical protein